MIYPVSHPLGALLAISNGRKKTTRPEENKKTPIAVVD
jgi:hypothetical protein